MSGPTPSTTTTPPAEVKTSAPPAGTTLLTAPDTTPGKAGATADTTPAGKDGAAPPGEPVKKEAPDKDSNADTKAVAPEEGTPAEVEVKLPDGVQADPELLKGFVATAKEIGIDSAKAQKVLDLYVAAQTQAQQKADADWAKQLQEWKDQVGADKELGGEGMKANLAAAKKAVARFGTPELAQVLDSSGLGNHPELVRLLARAGKALAEDSVAGTSSPTSQRADQDPFLAIYTTMQKEQ